MLFSHLLYYQSLFNLQSAGPRALSPAEEDKEDNEALSKLLLALQHWLLLLAASATCSPGWTMHPCWSPACSSSSALAHLALALALPVLLAHYESLTCRSFLSAFQIQGLLPRSLQTLQILLGLNSTFTNHVHKLEIMPLHRCICWILWEITALYTVISQL